MKEQDNVKRAQEAVNILFDCVRLRMTQGRTGAEFRKFTTGLVKINENFVKALTV